MHANRRAAGRQHERFDLARRDLEYPRAEAAGILLTTSSHRGMQPDDRAYLVRLTAATTGLAA
jgi:hypothetical protein